MAGTLGKPSNKAEPRKTRPYASYKMWIAQKATSASLRSSASKSEARTSVAYLAPIRILSATQSVCDLG